MATVTGNGLEGLRLEIDRIDRGLLDLLEQRAQTAHRIAGYKREHGLDAYDPERERRVLDGLAKQNGQGLPNEAVVRIFREIISACRAVQGGLAVSFLGPEDTFSHRAAVEYFGHSVSLIPRGSISDVFREVEHGRAGFGVVPAENSNEGAVGLTLDEWSRSELLVCGEILLPVSQTLMSRQPSLSGVRRVYSHPQALAQCREWLSRNLSGATLVETSSTSAAAARTAVEDEAAAVGGSMLAERHSLNILASNIQDQALNLTRFLVLGRDQRPPSGRDKTSILFKASHRPGALYQALKPLSDAGVNLTRIESRPSRERPWEYVFFIDFEGHQSDDKISRALELVTRETIAFKVLGSYPAAGPEPGSSEN